MTNLDTQQRMIAEDIIKRPLWEPFLIAPQNAEMNEFEREFDDKTIEFMRRHNDVDGMPSARTEIDFEGLEQYEFGYQIGPYNERTVEFWDETLPGFRKMVWGYEKFQGQLGLIQRAFEAAAGIDCVVTWERIYDFRLYSYDLAQPQELSWYLRNSHCRLLWGQSKFYHQTAYIKHELGFLLADRELVIHVMLDPNAWEEKKNGGIECLHVTLLRGAPLDEEWWGEKLPDDTQ